MNSESNKKLKVVVAGGGTAGWMTAAAFSRLLGHVVDVNLIESDDIPTVGVGEATIPTMRAFHHLLGIDEKAFMQATQATFKLGIQFENWGELNQDYFHSFGETGRGCWAGDFQHFWLRSQKMAFDYKFSDFSPELQVAKADKFALPEKPKLNYAYHLDAGLYAKFLRQFSEQYKARRTEGKIVQVEQDGETGFIKALVLASGERIEGDLFIDCSGFRGLLIEQTLHAGYENWSEWFLCDRAVAAQTKAVSEPIPYTRAIAHAHGWQWRIPLQHRCGNGFVYSSKYMADEDAINLLLSNIEGERLNEPRVIQFNPGKRKQLWLKNCVAIGLSSGFIEPLESTSIHLISSSVVRLMKMMPLNGIQPTDVAEYNRQAQKELEDIRDFVALHYWVTSRDDSGFWRYCRSMDVAESLRDRVNMYRDSARMYWREDELFTVNSWNQVMLGQGIKPKTYHPVADLMPDEEFKQFLDSYRSNIQKFVSQLPSHQEFLKSYCPASMD